MNGNSPVPSAGPIAGYFMTNNALKRLKNSKDLEIIILLFLKVGFSNKIFFPWLSCQNSFSLIMLLAVFADPQKKINDKSS